MQQTILVVDDDRLIRQILADILTGANYLVLEAADGREGVELARQRTPDAILLDFYMPHLNGAEVCAELRRLPSLRYVPILLLTSNIDNNSEINPFQIGADDYLAKPVNASDLLARIRGCLAKKQTLRLIADKAHNYQALIDISSSVASTLSPEDILRQIVKRIAGHLDGIERCSIVVIQQDEQTGYVLASSDNPAITDLRLDLARYPEIRKVMVDGKSLLVDDIREHPLLQEVLPFLGVPQFDSLMVLPIHFREQVIGVMIVRAERGGRGLAEHELNFCQLVANVAAPALKNARVFGRTVLETELLKRHATELEENLRLKTIYHQLYENASEGLAALDEQFRPVYVNRRGLALLGIPEDGARDHSFLEFLDPSFRDVFCAKMLQSITEESERVRFDARLAGRGRTLSMSISPHRVMDRLAVIAFRDVTGKRAMERELEETKTVLEQTNRKLLSIDKARAEFLNTATHELRIPVTIVQGYCSLIEDCGTDNLNDRQRDYLHAAVTSSNRLVDLVNNLLDLARFDAGRHPLELASGDLHATIRDAWLDVEPLTKGRGLDFQFVTQPGLVALYDEQGIQRVFANLLTNAVKFTPEGGTVKVWHLEHDDTVEVVVEDTGVGIPEHQVDLLFEEFTQVGQGGDRRGSGLGLAICKRIVEQHGGRIWAESSPGAGSRFRFTLKKPT